MRFQCNELTTQDTSALRLTWHRDQHEWRRALFLRVHADARVTTAAEVFTLFGNVPELLIAFGR